MRRIFLMMLCCLSICPLSAQNIYGVEANFLAGKVLKHREYFKAPIPELTTAYEFLWLKQTNGTSAWEQGRHYPLWGIGTSLVHYGVDSVYGNAISLYPVLQAPIIRTKSFEWTFRAGFGVGYVTRRFERAPGWDTLNNAIGSRLNNFSMFATSLRYRINSHWSIHTGVDFFHLSNAAVKKPNLGVNVYGGFIGLRYWPFGDRKPRVPRERQHLSNRMLVQTRLGIAFNESGDGDGPLYRSYLASLYASKRYSSKNKILLGIDYSYHQNIYAFLRNNGISVGNERAESWRSAVFIGHEWLFGKMSFITQMGFYIKDVAFPQDFFYEKLGYNYYLIRDEHGPMKELALSVLVKTHKEVAELFEFGVTLGF